MKKVVKRLYEGMYIINANLSEDARKKALEKITQSIEAKDGEIHKIHDWGKRRLAYEINKKREGYYKDLIRFLTLKAEAVQESLEFKHSEQHS